MNQKEVNVIGLHLFHSIESFAQTYFSSFYFTLNLGTIGAEGMLLSLMLVIGYNFVTLASIFSILIIDTCSPLFRLKKFSAGKEAMKKIQS